MLSLAVYYLAKSKRESLECIPKIMQTLKNESINDVKREIVQV
jgi:hypothetical protein